MRNRFLSLLMVFCVFSFTVDAQQYGKIVNHFDKKEVVQGEKQDLNKNFFVPFKSNVNIPSKVDYLTETFDTEIPATWTINNTGSGSFPGWFWAETDSHFPFTGLAVIDSDANGSGNPTSGELISPVFDCSSATGIKLEFDARYNDISTDGGDYFAVEVFDGTDWQNVLTWDEDHGTAAEAESVSIDITSYINANCQVKFVYDDADAWAWYVGIDNIHIFEPDPYNLSALDLLGSPFATVGEEKTFDIILENIGTEIVPGADYTFNLIDTAGGTVLSSVSGVDIDPAAIDTVSLSFTPAAPDTIVVKGVIDYGDDMNMSDNETETMELIIQSSDVYTAQVGMDETFPPSRIPFDFFYKNSASQTIYTPEQLGINGGILETIAYENNFSTNLAEGRPVKIWIGETDQTTMDGGWIDPASLVLVYDDTVSFPAGRNIIPIPLSTPYIYGGGNLVIYTYRVFEDEYHSSSDEFYGTEIPESNCTMEYNSDTEFSDDLSGVDGDVISWVPNTTLFFSTAGLGGLTGTVTSSGTPVEGVNVQIVGSYSSTVTDAAGEYIFPYLIPGTYDVEFSKFGYETNVLTDVTVLEEDTVVADATITPIPTYSVSGTITSSDLGTGIEGAAVSLDGYETYLDSTDASGVFTITDVYGGTRDYLMTVSYPGYTTYQDTITVVDGDLTGVDVVLEEIPYPPIGVNAYINPSDEAVVTWLEPGTQIPAEFRYDNGVQTGQLGSSGGTDNTVLGSVHRVNAQLHEVSWFTTAEGGPHTTVNVFIFDLDESGEPTNNVLYSAMAVPNTDMDWTVHTLADPVNAPNGFMIAISYAGFAGLGTTDPDDDYPYTDNTHYYSSDYTTGEFLTVESLGDPTLEKPFMIRAFGYEMGKNGYTPGIAKAHKGNQNHSLKMITNEPVVTEGPVFSDLSNGKELIDYTVYRLQEGQDMVDWVEIGTNVVDTSFIDTDWATQTFGLYQYAVVANYTNGVYSDPTLSNVLPKDMTVDYTVNITTNTSEDATGAIVTLTNQDADPTHVYTLTADASGVVFDSVWRGTYDIVVEKPGFEVYSESSIAIEEPGLTNDVELIEIIEEPYGLTVEQDGNVANFSWNGSFAGSVLVVDHDASNAVDFTDDWAYIQPVLDANEVDYTYYEADATSYDGPDLATMQEYDAIIWFTGEGWQNGQTLTTTDETNLASYLDGGGKLFLSSQDYVWDVYSQADTYTFNAGQFPYDYLGVVSVAQDVWWQSGGESLDHVGTAGSSAEGFSFTCDDIYTTTKEGLSCDQITDHNAMDMLTITTAPEGLVAIQNSNTVFWAGSFASVTDEQVRGDLLMAILDYLATSKKADEGKALQSYSVYLDDMTTPVATGITDSTYQFTDLSLGTYTAGVKSIYESGESSVVSVDFEIMGEVTFVVQDEDGNTMEGAMVTMEGNDHMTDVNGEVSMMMTAGEHSYTVSMLGYDDVSGTIMVDAMSMTETITMIASEYTVTFEAMYDGTTALEGVEIDIDSEYMLTTDASGIATVALTNGTYSYTATLTDYYDYTGSFDVANTDMTITMNMTPVGINDANARSLSIYPNPSNGVINISSEGQFDIAILNSVGQVIYSNEFTDKTEIDLGNSAAGVYFIRIASDEKVITKPIIIE
ncbi:hypothetical protein L21SP5_03396 [Salinivirga cyanobacteriivorans]|uniref:Secretion system C-terminal sorting domain-containing protein n=1 Tax=Salinivirga cyanobacteriivorans TaxID=1307839 RepID=A0A0S2I3V6_9BACT|nr:carboxypeptidase regulatory-like domain-containing protein [Salinivirga cyanobacteriivorans]ALO17009.1 hypothetical protein L21SP5_03396 [Salinivirga cyanobacteriivorans]